MYFHVYSFKLQIHAHIYRSFIRHHKMLGVRIAKRKNEPQKPANPCGTKLRTRIFLGAGKFASQTYSAGELKSRGNPAKVSPANIPFLADNRKCCIFFVNAKQKENTIRQDGVFFLEQHFCYAKVVACGRVIEREWGNPSKVPPSHSPLLAVGGSAGNKTCGQSQKRNTICIVYFTREAALSIGRLLGVQHRP